MGGLSDQAGRIGEPSARVRSIRFCSFTGVSCLNCGGEPKAPPADEWMDTVQAASYLGLTPKAVREGAARGSLPGCKYPLRSIRGVWRFKKDDLDRFLKRGQAASRRRATEPSVWD